MLIFSWWLVFKGLVVVVGFFLGKAVAYKVNSLFGNDSLVD